MCLRRLRRLRASSLARKRLLDISRPRASRRTRHYCGISNISTPPHFLQCGARLVRFFWKR
jgi:hypothetical protein